MDRKLNILLLCPTLEPGGAERQLVLLADRLLERGHEVHVALFRKRGPLLNDLPEGVCVHDVKKGGRLDLFGFLFRLRRLVKSLAPDVLYSFLGVPNLATVALKFLGCRTPLVWSVRASDVDLNAYGWLPKACGVLEARLSCFADRIISNSEAGKRHAMSLGFSDEAMSVIPNGIDTERFSPDRAIGEPVRKAAGCRPDYVLVGLVARLDPMKDHRTFLRAARLIFDTNPLVRFACVGDGPLEEELPRLTREMGLGDVVTWLGRRNDMVAVYNAMDVCCLSSAFGEGFPNVIGEAMSCGVPCVVTDVGDAALVVGENGLVVSRGDHQALADGILEIIERKRSGTVENPRGRIETEFSVEAMVENTERAMFELIE